MQDLDQVGPFVHFMLIAARGGQFIIIQVKARILLFCLIEVKSGNESHKSAELLPGNMCKSFPTR